MNPMTEIVIEANRPWWKLRVNELIAYKDLVYLMMRRDFLSRYRQTILGPAWYIIQPLITALIFTAIFGRLAGIPTDRVPQFLFYQCGLLAFALSSQVFSGTATSFTANAALYALKIHLCYGCFKCSIDAGSAQSLSNQALSGRGLVNAPSAPCLALSAKDPAYTKQLAASKLAIPDSGAMVLMWRLVHPKTLLRRASGLAFLEALLKDPRLREPGALFLVDPTAKASQRNREFLKHRGVDIPDGNQYVAPMYTPTAVEDLELFERLHEMQPRYVLINLGGGIQERLGAWLQGRFEKEDTDLPTIICTGAAIAFLTGEQIQIPKWADRLFLGWAMRCIDKPALYIPRYFKSIPVLYYALKDALGKK